MTEKDQICTDGYYEMKLLHDGKIWHHKKHVDRFSTNNKWPLPPSIKSAWVSLNLECLASICSLLDGGADLCIFVVVFVMFQEFRI